MKGRWQNALILMLVCALVGGGVAWTYSVAGPVIERRALAAADAARLSLFPEADRFETIALAAESPLHSCCRAEKDGVTLGYLGSVTVSGSQSMIEVTAAMDREQRLLGIRVGGPDFAETPGMGARVRDAEFTGQFAGLMMPAILQENVDGISGATVSSAAVVKGVNLIGEEIAQVIEREG